MDQTDNVSYRLTRKYINTYGDCGSFQYHKETSQDELLGTQYFFYVAFETSNDNDFVTNKILKAIHHNTVPIVYGGADYSRYLRVILPQYLDYYILMF